jgi:transposase
MRLSKISPYPVVRATPGGLLMLPALAWWLDRRCQRKHERARACDRRALTALRRLARLPDFP